MPDTTVKHFTSDMTSAPVVSNTAGTLIALLDACLVDGFGLLTATSVVVADGIATVTTPTAHSAKVHSVVLMAGSTPGGLNGEKKVLSAATNTFTFDATGISDQTATGTITTKMPGAGWTKVYSGTNKAVYRSPNVASTQTYIRIDDSNAAYARPVGYLSMTDVDTGTGVFSACYFNRTNGVAGNRDWWLAANDTFCYFGITTHSGGSPVVCAFGDIIPRRSGDPYRFIISGAANVASNWGGTAADMSPIVNVSGYAIGNTVARSYTQVGSGVAFRTAMAFNTPAAGNSGVNGTIQFPNGGDNSIIFSQAHVVEATSACLRGRVPGCYMTPQTIGATLTHDYAITDMPDVPNKTVLWKLTGYSSGYAGFGLDVTGPWA